MKKNQRQQLIKQLISERSVRTQEELLQLLEQKGVRATQATISRDIREMKLIKSQDKDGLTHYALFEQPSFSLSEERLQSAVKREVLKIQTVQFLVVVATEKNGADVVTNWLDEISYPEVAATIAGFDTFIVICRTDEDAKNFAEKLEAMRG